MWREFLPRLEGGNGWRGQAIWLEVDSEDKDTDTSHYFFLRGKPLASLQYLEKSLASDRIQGTRLALVAAFTNYATLMSKIGQHAHSKRLVVYALRLLQHYVSSEGTLIKGRVVNEKVGLDGESSDPRFVSIRSSAAVVLHNVAVEQLILAEIPNFGESLGRAGEALLAAQNSLGPHHPWRAQVENSHHVILQLCKRGKRIDITRPLKAQVTPISNKQAAKGSGSVLRTQSHATSGGGGGGGSTSPAARELADLDDDNDDGELGRGGGGGGMGGEAAQRSEATTRRLAPPPRPSPALPRHHQPLSSSSRRLGTPDSDVSSLGEGGLSREERLQLELARIQQERLANAAKQGVKGITVSRPAPGVAGGSTGRAGAAARRSQRVETGELDQQLAQASASTGAGLQRQQSRRRRIGSTKSAPRASTRSSLSRTPREEEAEREEEEAAAAAVGGTRGGVARSSRKQKRRARGSSSAPRPGRRPPQRTPPSGERGRPGGAEKSRSRSRNKQGFRGGAAPPMGVRQPLSWLCPWSASAACSVWR
jgi:hypothetical protein